MFALLIVGTLLWLSWEMGRGADIKSPDFWKQKRRGIVVGDPFRRLLVIFCSLSALVLYLTLDRAVAKAPAPLVGSIAALFLGVGGAGLWATLRRRQPPG